MKKLIFLFISVVFLSAAAQAQSQPLNSDSPKTQEIKKVSPQTGTTTVTANSKMGCNSSQCKKGGANCNQSKMSKSKTEGSSQTLGNANETPGINSPAPDPQPQTTNTKSSTNKLTPRK